MPVQTTNIFTEDVYAIEFESSSITWTIANGIIISSSNSNSIYMRYNFDVVYNYGIVQSDGSVSVIMNSLCTVTNGSLGSIIGTTGISMEGNDSSIFNAGLISGTPFYGIAMSADNLKVTNTGSITGLFGILINQAETQQSIFNVGYIIGAASALQTVQNLSSPIAGLIKIFNSGSIIGPEAIDSYYRVQLVNSSIISGSVNLSGFADTVINSGSIFGQTALGAGEDRFDGRGGSTNGYLVAGGLGNDTLFGGGFDDTFDGGDDKDILKGFAGDDVLQGGKGVDTLFGGRGGDTFLYVSVADSGGAGSTRDVIRDFSSLEGDVIDLGLIDANSTVKGNQAFAFIGSSEFSGVAGELRYEFASNGIVVYGDINGDLRPDFSIQLNNAFNLTASDFLL